MTTQLIVGQEQVLRGVEDEVDPRVARTWSGREARKVFHSTSLHRDGNGKMQMHIMYEVQGFPSVLQ